MSMPASLELGNWESVRLVAGREMSVRFRSKGYRITTVVMVVILVALAIVMKLVSGSGGGGDTIGYTARDAVLAAQVKIAAESTGQSIQTQLVPSEAAGRDLVRNGKLDGLFVGDPTSVTVVVKQDIDTKTQAVLNTLASSVALQDQIRALHGDPTRVLSAAAAAKATVRPLEPPHTYQTQQLILGIIAGFLIYMSLMMHGQSVAQGVVEEKSSRVVELLLATVRPWQLMAGKVLGIGVVGLIQMIVIGAVGLVAGIATGVLPSVSAAVGTVIWLVVWYLIGFFMYAIVFAAMGALVSRQEEIPTVTFPALICVVIGWVVGISILPYDPGNTAATILSIIPMFAVVLMPMRLAIGGVPVWESALSVVLVLAMIPALIWLTARIYRNAVLRTGARVKLSQALSAA